MAAELHLAEDALALHLLLQRFEGLIDIIVTDENLHASFLWLWSYMVLDVPEPADPRQSATRGLPISCACSRISLPSPPAGGGRLSEFGDPAAGFPDPADGLPRNRGVPPGGRYPWPVGKTCVT